MTDLPENLPIAVIVPDGRARERFLRYSHSSPFFSRDVEVLVPTAASLSGKALCIVVIHPDVNPDAAVEGEGSLISLIRSRQSTFGDRARIIAL